MAHELLRWTVLAFACAPIAYCAFAFGSARRFFRRVGRTDDPRFAPPVSILKPVRGLDRHAFDNFASFCRLDYPDYELLFAVADADDPAISVVNRLAAAFPDHAIRLIVGAPERGPSSKVSKLCRLAVEARHDLLVVSDSDIAVAPDYLRAIASPFREARVGAVTCLYRGVPDGGVWADLEAIGISTDFMPGVLVAERTEGMTFTLGATMATTRTHLSAIGGFEALVEYCADDFELGRRIAARGDRVELAACTVSTECAPSSFARLFTHELRWAITVRHSRPWGFAGRLLFAHGLPWTIAAVAVAPSQTVAAAYVIAYLLTRFAVAWQVGVRGLGDATVRRRWWLVPVHDALAFAIAIVACWSNRIEWRGRTFHLRRGRLLPIPNLTNEEGATKTNV